MIGRADRNTSDSSAAYDILRCIVILGCDSYYILIRPIIVVQAMSFGYSSILCILTLHLNQICYNISLLGKQCWWLLVL